MSDGDEGKGEGPVRRLADQALAWARRVLTEPRSELTRWQRRVRFAADLGRYGARQLDEDQAPQMAAALAYRTLFGMLPVLVVATIVARALDGFDAIRARVAEQLEELGLDQIRVTAPDATDESPSLATWLLDLLAEVESLDLTALTWVGLAVLFYSAIGLMVTIENGFNRIHRAPGGRPWSHRLPIYWTVLTLGPLAVTLPNLLNRRLREWLEGTDGLTGLSALTAFTGFFTLWLVVFAIFKWLPNTRVRGRPAAWGALVTAILVEVLRRSMGAYVGNAISVKQLYGSLGLIPLFMFWVYLLWLVVLFGAEVTAALQKVREGAHEAPRVHRELPVLTDPTSILLLMALVAERFGEGRPTSLTEACAETGLPQPAAALMLARLSREGLLYVVEEDERTYALTRPPDQIRADALLDLAYDMTGGAGGSAIPLLQRLRDSQRELAAGADLAAVAASMPKR